MERYNEEDGSQSPVNNDPVVPANVNGEDEVFVLDDFGLFAENANRENSESDASALLQGTEPQSGDGDDTYVMGDESEEAAKSTPFAPELEMVELGAAAGEAAGVEPPVEALTEAIEPIESQPAMVEAAPDDFKLRRRVWIPAALAALALFAAGGTILYQRMQPAPEETSTLSALPSKPPVDPAASVKPEDRPNLSKGSTQTEPGTPTEPEVLTTPGSTAAQDPMATEDPVPAQPEPQVNPEFSAGAGSLTAGGDSAAVNHEPEAGVPDLTEPVAVETVAPEPAAMEPGKTGEPATALASLARGTEVLVRLRNGNFFNGKLDRFTPDEARLRFPKGIIEFQVRDVEVIIPMNQAPRKVGPQTVVELKNGNKLVGRLVDDVSDHVTLAVGGAEITVPRTAVASVNLRSPLGLVMGDEVPATPATSK